MVVALVALIVAIGGTAAALPGKFTVGRDDMKNSSIGARAIGKALLDQLSVFPSTDPFARDGNYTEVEGTIMCPNRAPLALDPSVGALGTDAFLVRQTSIANKWGGPGGYLLRVLSDKGPNAAFTARVNCLPAR